MTVDHTTSSATAGRPDAPDNGAAPGALRACARDRGHAVGARLLIRRLFVAAALALPIAMLSGCGHEGATPEAARADTAAVPSAPNRTTTPDQKEVPMGQETNAGLDDDGKLQLRAGPVQISVAAAAVRAFGEHVQHCESGCEIVIDRGDGAARTVSVNSLYVDGKATFYRGPLTESARKGHSLILTDVDGDGVEDLIVWTGLEGAYGGPSYDVYLYSSETGYAYSQDISDLTLGATALFTIESGRLKVPSKDGCCFHAYDTYALSGGVPTLIERITEDSSGEGPPVVRTQRLVDGELKEVASEDR